MNKEYLIKFITMVLNDTTNEEARADKKKEMWLSMKEEPLAQFYDGLSLGLRAKKETLKIILESLQETEEGNE